MFASFVVIHIENFYRAVHGGSARQCDELENPDKMNETNRIKRSGTLDI